MRPNPRPGGGGIFCVRPRIPHFDRRDPGIVHRTLYRAKVDGEEHRHRLRAPRPANKSAGGSSATMDLSKTKSSPACESLCHSVPACPCRSPRSFPPLAVPESRPYCCVSNIARSPAAASGPPRLRIVHALAVIQRQRIGQGVFAYLRFVVVHGNSRYLGRQCFRCCGRSLGTQHPQGEDKKTNRRCTFQEHSSVHPQNTVRIVTATCRLERTLKERDR